MGRSPLRACVALSAAFLATGASFSAQQTTGNTSAEESPAACAVLMAKTVPDLQHGYRLLSIIECMGTERREEAAQLRSRALELAQRAKDPETLAKLGQKDRALELLSQALRAAEALEDRHGRLDGMSLVALRYAKLGELDQAVQVANRIGHPRESQESHRASVDWDKTHYLTIIAREHLEAGQKARALDILGQARELTKALDHEHWEAMRLEEIAIGYADAGELERALEVVGQMKETLVLPEEEARLCPVRFKIIALVKVANRYAGIGQKERARQVLSRAYDLAAKIQFKYLRAEMLKDLALTYGGVGEYRHMHILLPGERQREPPDHARGLEIARTIEHPLLKARTLEWMAGSCLKAGDREEGLRLLSEALQAASSIQDGSRHSCVRELGFLSFDKEAVLHLIAHEYAEAGLFDQALQIAEAMARSERGGVLRDIAASYVRHGQKEKALGLLSQSLQAVGPTKEIALAYAAAGECERALNTAKAIKPSYDRAEALEELAAKLVEAERFDEALEAAAAVGEAVATAKALARIGARYPKPGQTVSDRARRILREIAQKAGGRK